VVLGLIMATILCFDIRQFLSLFWWRFL